MIEYCNHTPAKLCEDCKAKNEATVSNSRLIDGLCLPVGRRIPSYMMADEIAKELLEEKTKIENYDRSDCSPRLKGLLKKLTEEDIKCISLALTCNIALRLREQT